MVAVCFVDPSSFFCVCGQFLGIDALGGKDGEVGGVGVKAGAVFADAGIRADPNDVSTGVVNLFFNGISGTLSPCVSGRVECIGSLQPVCRARYGSTRR